MGFEVRFGGEGVHEGEELGRAGVDVGEDAGGGVAEDLCDGFCSGTGDGVSGVGASLCVT